MSVPAVGAGGAGRALATLRSPTFQRFLVVGGLNTALGLVLFRVALHLYGDVRGAAGLAQATAYAAGIAISFVANRRWTFRSAGAARRELPRFLVAHLGALVASSLLMQGGVSVLRLPVMATWVLVVGFTTLLNFGVQRGWVFRQG